MTAQGTVYIVDDDEGVRIGLSALLSTVGYEVQCFPSARSFLEDEHAALPACLLLDVRMPGMSGLELQKELQSCGFRSPVIMLTAHADVPMVIRAMKAGAVDFLQKPFNEQELLDRIHESMEKDRKRLDLDANIADLRACYGRLTRREREVMQMLIGGAANKRIAGDLGISERTVEHHRANVMKKMDARSFAQLVEMNLKLQPRE